MPSLSLCVREVAAAGEVAACFGFVAGELGGAAFACFGFVVGELGGAAFACFGFAVGELAGAVAECFGAGLDCLAAAVEVLRDVVAVCDSVWVPSGNRLVNDFGGGLADAVAATMSVVAIAVAAVALRAVRLIGSSLACPPASACRA
jgi:hypothetical protein